MLMRKLLSILGKRLNPGSDRGFYMSEVPVWSIENLTLQDEGTERKLCTKKESIQRVALSEPGAVATGSPWRIVFTMDPVATAPGSDME